MHQLVKAGKALSSEVRIRMLNVIRERECCVCEIMQVLGITESCASRNLRILYEAGFFKLRREGLWVLYSIDMENTKGHYIALHEAVRQASQKDETVIEDRQRLKSAERMGPVCASRS